MDTTDTLQTLTQRIADRSARAEIESFCLYRELTEDGYAYDTHATEPDTCRMVDDAAAYLIARGLARALPGRSHLLVILDNPPPPSEPERMNDGIEAPTLIDLATRHGLETYLYGSQPPFCVVGTPRSIQRLSAMLSRLEEATEALELILENPDHRLLDIERKTAEAALGRAPGTQRQEAAHA